MNRSVFLFVGFLCALGAPTFAFAQAPHSFSSVPREVLAFYYPWYGSPERHREWVHWRKVNAETHDISDSTHYPAQGAYDSYDPAVIDRHIDQAKASGITGFIGSWWGHRTYEDGALRIVLAEAEKKNLKLSLYWETAPGKERAQIDHAVADLVYL